MRLSVSIFGYVFVAICVLLLSGCTANLASSPNLFFESSEDPFAETPPPSQSNLVQLYYLTDRARCDEPDGETRYGFARSNSLAFGAATVSIGDDLSWDALVEQSRMHQRTRSVRLRLTDVREAGRFPPSSVPFVEIDGERVRDPSVVAAGRDKASLLSDELTARLREMPRKEIFLFVHGVNNTFEDASFGMAQLWHFIGRVGLPVLYTWPAGRPGLLRGYQFDRESSEFTVFHLRETLRFLAECEDVEKIHIIAHSRGADVAMSALRELHIGARGAGVDTRAKYKLGTVILAAPDLDMQVVGMRIGADGLHLVPEQMVIYLSEHDRAIGVSSWLFSSVSRLGQLRMSDVAESHRESMALFPEIQFVDVDVPTDFLGHGYFISNRAVLSDLILVLRDNRLPGRQHGRPLGGGDGEFWILDEDYPEFEP